MIKIMTKKPSENENKVFAITLTRVFKNNLGRLGSICYSSGGGCIGKIASKQAEKLQLIEAGSEFVSTNPARAVYNIVGKGS